MKTLNREKSEKLFHDIKLLGQTVSLLSGVVQNPDFVNKDNAQENFDIFIDNYEECLIRLIKIKDEIYKLHNEIASIET